MASHVEAYDGVMLGEEGNPDSPTGQVAAGGVVKHDGAVVAPRLGVIVDVVVKPCACCGKMRHGLTTGNNVGSCLTRRVFARSTRQCIIWLDFRQLR